MAKGLPRLLAPALAVCLLLAGCAKAVPPSVGPLPQAAEPAAAQTAPEPAPRPLQCLYYEKDLFLAGCAAPALYPERAGLVAGLVPHHLVAADMISGFFALAGAQPGGYDRIILVSPSHYPQRCGSEVVTASAGWDTPYGPVPGDGAVAGALLANAALGAADDPAALEFDHGVAGLMPYLARYLPGVPVTGCLLSTRLEDERLDALWAVLTPYCGDSRTLLIASADASHYQRPQVAARRDAETARAIESLDYRTVAAFTDSNIDSPQAVATFMRAAEAAGTAPVQLDNATSEDKLPRARSSEVFAQGVTSYFVYAAFSE